ncbi:MAG: zinc metalloprotease [Marmoricola sp.]|jgi:membrane-associated protease RseP (regulator of RpoE activity)|nr:zinc metalloprotease [Marmoricola sp.]
MTVLTYTLGVLLFAVGVAVSIGLHEMGHLVPGKLFNVKVTQFFVGFGRTLWSKQRGETEYGLKAIPLGGYCKLVGMLPPAADQDADRVRNTKTGMFAQLMDDARSAEYELVDPHDHGRLFYDKPWWQRVIIMGSGVAINIVIAFVLFAIVFMGHGVATPTTTVASVSQCVIAVTKANADKPTRECRPTDPVAPARKAGLLPGDRILSFNGQPAKSWSLVQQEIRSNGDKTATLVVERNGRKITLRVSTVVSPVRDLNDPTRITKRGFLGVVPKTTIERQGIGFVVTTMADGTWQTLKAIGSMPVKLYHVARAAVGLEKRDPNGPMSVVGAGRVAGEMASAQQVSVSDRFFSVLALLAGLNLFLGLINLVPLPPFDGGGIATTLYEAVRRGWARMRGKPDPGGVDAAKLLPVTYVMAGVILVMSIVLIYADIVAPVSLS